MARCRKRILLILVLTLAMAVSQPFAAVNVYAEPSGSDGESVLEAPAQTAVPDAEEADNDELFEEYAAQFQSPNNAAQRMKELWSYLIGSFADGEKHFKRIRKARDHGEYLAAAEAVFRECEYVK